MRITLVLTLMLIAALPAASQSQSQRQPPCQAAEFRALDFWVGDWELFSEGESVGLSRISLESHGCLLVEQWFGNDGARGISLNFYHPVAKEWRQHFVGDGWNVDYLGVAEPGGMRFEGRGIRPDGTRPRTRMNLRKRSDGTVTHRKEESEDGSNWKTVYEFLYRKAVAQGSPDFNPRQRCPGEKHRQFVFWLGRWNVTSGDKHAGRNEILPRANGCVLYENWAGAQGGEGKSLNFVDIDSGKWRQIWVSPGAYLNLEGEWRDGALRYEGKSRYPGSQGDTLEQLSFTPSGDRGGSVRQLWRQSTDGGKTWNVVFDGLYRPEAQ